MRWPLTLVFASGDEDGVSAESIGWGVEKGKKHLER